MAALLEKQKRIINMMFPAQEKYHGNVCFGVRTANGFKSMGFSDINKLEEKISKIKFYKNSDYYLTANTTRTGVRTTDNLFSYNNIVIDIDCHTNRISIQELEDKVDELLYRIERDLYLTDDVPQHNISVKTGRGVQLWWCMEQTATNLGWLFHGARDSLMRKIEDLIDEYSELSYFSVDKSSSKKDIGFYRLPFTTNTKTGTVVEGNIVCEKRYNINDFYNAIKIEREVKPVRKPFLKERWNNLLSQRISIIEDYTEIKVKEQVKDGYRDNYAWLYYNACYQLHGEEKANEMLDELNATFIVPLKENEIGSIKKYIKSKGGLRMKNQTFFDYLGEEPVIKTREMEREEKRMKKEIRKKKIKELYLTGRTVKEICEEMEMSKPTILKILRIKELKMERNKKIQVLEEQGKTTKEIARIFKLSCRTIQYIKKQIKEKVKTIVEKEKNKEQNTLHQETKTRGKEYQIILHSDTPPPTKKSKIFA